MIFISVFKFRCSCIFCCNSSSNSDVQLLLQLWWATFVATLMLNFCCNSDGQLCCNFCCIFSCSCCYIFDATFVATLDAICLLQLLLQLLLQFFLQLFFLQLLLQLLLWVWCATLVATFCFNFLLKLVKIFCCNSFCCNISLISNQRNMISNKGDYVTRVRT